MTENIKLSDGYNGHTVNCSLEPIIRKEIKPNVKVLLLPVIGSTYLCKWFYECQAVEMGLIDLFERLYAEPTQ